MMNKRPRYSSRPNHMNIAPIAMQNTGAKYMLRGAAETVRALNLRIELYDSTISSCDPLQERPCPRSTAHSGQVVGPQALHDPTASRSCWLKQRMSFHSCRVER